MKKSRKIIMALCSLFLVSALTGCGTANIGTNTTLNEKGAGTFSFKVATTGIFAQGSSLDTNSQDVSKGSENKLFNSPLGSVESKKYKDGQTNIEEKTIDFKSVQELNDLFKDAKDTDLNVNIKEDKGLFKTTYIYTLKLPKDFSMNNMTGELDKQKDSMTTLGITSDQIVSFLGQAISFSSSVTLPGKVISQNATSVSGNTLKWDYAFSQVNPENIMTATCEVTNTTNIYIAVGIGVLVIIIVMLGVVKGKKKKDVQVETVNDIDNNPNGEIVDAEIINQEDISDNAEEDTSNDDVHDVEDSNDTDEDKENIVEEISDASENKEDTVEVSEVSNDKPEDKDAIEEDNKKE